jgi:kynurenine 3-monooxygenase
MTSTTLLGAGLSGSLMAILLARRGVPVRLLERRPDPRLVHQSAGRSINLALAERGIHALKTAGMFTAIESLLIPMRGRCVHDLSGATQLVAYGQREREVIYSISRPGLNEALLNYAGRLPGVEVIFDQSCTAVDLYHRRIELHRHDEAQGHTESFTQLIAADGYMSEVRAALLRTHKVAANIDWLAHGYKELTLPANALGHHQIDKHALHIWPRGGFMLIALPNLDGSFTVTLFLPFTSSAAQPGFDQLENTSAIVRFFDNYFPDALALMPSVAEEFMTHPTGKMATVRSPQWSNNRNTVLIGDAAHAIVPFHGQGMNCAFEDCIALDALLQHHDFGTACEVFTRQRQPNANAIADMALENYIEMRDTVRDPKFLLQKEVSFELERRCPQHFIPRYSMVMFHHDISYADAYARGKIQSALLDELTRNANSLTEIDWNSAEALVKAKLPPFK